MAAPSCPQTLVPELIDRLARWYLPLSLPPNLYSRSSRQCYNWVSFTMPKPVPSEKSAPPLSREARLKLGRDRRAQVSRKQLGEVRRRVRNFDPMELLIRLGANWLEQLLPTKYSRMAISPFAFFRGSVGIMAADLAAEPNTDITVQLCGDAHLENLGSFEGPDGKLVFDINDFDETIPGPWEWDVKRMATSIVLAGYESNQGRNTCARAVDAFAHAYCRTNEELAEEPIITAARHQIRRMRKAESLSGALAQSERATPLDLLTKYTTKTKSGSHQFKRIPGILWRVAGNEKEAVLASLPGYSNQLAPERRHWFDLYRIADVGFKVLGTGSVGLRDYLVLLFGNGEDDPLFLQIKQEVESAYAPYLKCKFGHQGKRVAEGQRRLQPLSDLLLGWTGDWTNDFLIRQLNDHKGAVNTSHLRADGLLSLAKVAGELLARGHARSGDALCLKGYIGSADKVASAVVDFALEYAAQVQLDFEQFQKAIEQGRIEVAAETKKANRPSSRRSTGSARASA